MRTGGLENMLELMMFEEDHVYHNFLIEIDSDLDSVQEWEHYWDMAMLLIGPDSTVLPAAPSGLLNAFLLMGSLNAFPLIGSKLGTS